MEYQFPKNIADFAPYDPIDGDYQIRLDANESYLQPNAVQLGQMEQAVQEIPYNRYPDHNASALCRRFAEVYGVDAGHVTAFNGSDEFLALLAGTFFGAGQKMAVLDYDFSMYRIYAQMYGTECAVIPKQDDLTICVDEILAYIEQNKVSALIFSNPCNPTSLGLDRDEVLRLIHGTKALIIVDEAYMDFWDQSVLDRAGELENLIVLKTCSKAIGFAAARIGFAVTTPRLTRMLHAVKSPYNLNSISQRFGEILLSDQEYIHTVTQEIIRRKEELQAGIYALKEQYTEITKVMDSKTNFIFFSTARNREVFDGLLARSIAVRYMGGYLRVCAGSKQENTAFLNAMKEILKG